MTTKAHIHHDPDAERSILGTVVSSGAEAAADAVCLLTERDFWTEKHRIGWRAVCAQYESGEPMDAMSVVMRARSLGVLEQMGGAPEVIEWQMAARGLTTMRHDIARVRKLASLRGVQAALSAGVQALSRPDADAEGTLDEVVQAVFDAVSDDADREAPQGFREIARTAMEAFKEAHEARQRGEMPGVPTGIESLDRAMGGLRKGKYVVIGARPGQGKTAMAQCFLTHALQKGHPVALYSMEMDEIDTAARFLALSADVPFASMVSGDMHGRQWDSVFAAIDRAKEWPLTFRRLSGTTPERLIRMARADVYRRKVKVIAIDYLQLVRGGPRDNAIEAVTKASLACKQIASELDVCVLALAQLNRQTADEPALRDLKQSGQIEQDADVVLFPFADADGGRHLKIGKFRGGDPSLRIALEWRGDLMRFREADRGAPVGPVGVDTQTASAYTQSGGDDDLPI